VVAALVWPTLLLAQQQRPAVPAPTTESAVIQALVTEIRELRLSLERSNLLTLRFQAALQANQIRADRVKDLSQQVDAATRELSEINGQRLHMSDQVRTIERDLINAEPTVRRDLEPRLSQLRIEFENLSRKESELRSRESLLLGEIRRETTQMDDWARWLQQFEQPLQPAK
jgi:hypothetical protein